MIRKIKERFYNLFTSKVEVTIRYSDFGTVKIKDNGTDGILEVLKAIRNVYKEDVMNNKIVSIEFDRFLSSSEREVLEKIFNRHIA